MPRLSTVIGWHSYCTSAHNCSDFDRQTLHVGKNKRVSLNHSLAFSYTGVLIDMLVAHPGSVHDSKAPIKCLSDYRILCAIPDVSRVSSTSAFGATVKTTSRRDVLMFNDP